jgi:hypothetical protein
MARAEMMCHTKKMAGSLLNRPSAIAQEMAQMVDQLKNKIAFENNLTSSG